MPATLTAAPAMRVPVVVRETRIEDLAQIEGLLRRRLGHDAAYWAYRSGRLVSHELSRPDELAGYPRYGYCAALGDQIIGSIFTLWSKVDGELRCQHVHWATEEGFLGLGYMLAGRALSHPFTTYIVQAHTPDVEELLMAQGYRRFSCGRHVAPFVHFLKVGKISEATDRLSLAHRELGCIALNCNDASYVFLPRKNWCVPFLRLVYCPSLDQLVRHWPMLSRHLGLRGWPFCQIDSNGPIAGIAGRFVKGWPKYWRGHAPPRPEIMAYSARVLWHN